MRVVHGRYESVPSFGAHPEVLEPETLRREIAQTLAGAAARYTNR